MSTARRRDGEWQAWLLAGLWALAIFAAAPFARSLQELVSERLGRQTFGYLTLAAVALAAAATMRHLARRGLPAASYGWLALVAAVFAGYTSHLWEEPEEALHFVEYGVLGVLLYRALRHRVRDRSIYVVAAMIGAAAGLLDELRFRDPETYREFVQTYTPITDPFVLEARLHLKRRDQHLEWARDGALGERRRRVHRTVAWRENRILERYFPRALRHSGYALPVGEIAELESGMLSEEELPANEVESAVAGRLITAVGEGQVLGLLVLAFLALVVIDRRYGDGG